MFIFSARPNYSTAEFDKEKGTLSFELVDGSSVTLSKLKFVTALGGLQGIPEMPPVYEPLPSDDDLIFISCGDRVRGLSSQHRRSEESKILSAVTSQKLQ